MKLRLGYLLSGIVTTCILLFGFIWTQPDGRLHIVFCNVGQGDASYVVFPDGRDMVIDGGPNDKIMDCLGRFMPFWDRHIDMVLMTHPQKDHMQGLISLFSRYTVDYFVRSDVVNSTQGYAALMDVVRDKHIEQKFVNAGQSITIGGTSLLFLWPSELQISKGLRETQLADSSKDVLGVNVGDLNDYSLVFALRYGSFDAIFTGDADTRVESEYRQFELADDSVELLKVPHHGSKTGMSQEFVNWVHPQVSIISVGKNSYGHPSGQVIEMLQNVKSRIVRTDEVGDIAVISDGMHWSIQD
jgi:competence protein ComEC